jgi:polysaccharide biosynthesis protein PslH
LNVLAVLPDPPLLEGGAAGRCTVGLLRGLDQHGVSVRSLAARRTGYATIAPPPDLHVELMDPPDREGWPHYLETVLRPCGTLSRGAFGARVAELARSADLLYLDQTDAGWCDVHTRVPSIVNVHYLMRHDRTRRNLYWQDAAAIVVRRVGERAIARRHRFIVANSGHVAAELKQLSPRAEITVVPLTLDPTHYERARLTGPPTAIFIGTAAWRPTRMALRRLVTSVWPLVRKRVPTAKLVIAGRGTDSIGLPDANGVEVLGPIDSAAQFFADASVMLFPLDKGSGMKVKLLEALASGVPIVTTPAGAEGFERSDGVVVVADGSEETFAAAAARILIDDLERRQRGAAAHETFHQLYVPEVATAPLVDLFDRMVAGAGK